MTNNRRDFTLKEISERTEIGWADNVVGELAAYCYALTQEVLKLQARVAQLESEQQ